MRGLLVLVAITVLTESFLLPRDILRKPSPEVEPNWIQIQRSQLKKENKEMLDHILQSLKKVPLLSANRG